MKPTKKKNRPKPYDEMSTTGAMTGPNPVERSYRPIARPDRTEGRGMRELEERSRALKSASREILRTLAGPRSSQTAARSVDAAVLRCPVKAFEETSNDYDRHQPPP